MKLSNRRQNRPAAKTDVDAARGNGHRPLLVYMNGILGSLNPSERLIAEYILSDPERVLYHTIAEMKRECGASVGSIVGFCRTMGVGGFADLKIALARELAGGGLPGGELEGKDGSVFDQVFRLHAKSLAETRQINPDSTLLEAARAIGKARRIDIFSTGISHAVAYAAYCKFALIGLHAFTEKDAHMQLVHAMQLAKGDVAFGISCSGCTKETVRCLEVARERKATTICLTNSIRSPITAFADIVLHATPGEVKYFQAPLASRVTQLAVIDSLFVALAVDRKSQTMSRLHRIGEQLIEHRVS
jgi:RpiR family transcriptional regulator, carbohydrate utilization regulator